MGIKGVQKISALFFVLFGLSVTAVAAKSPPQDQSGLDCYLIMNGQCRKTLPRPIPVSVPEFSRLSSAIGSTRKGGMLLFLMATQVLLDEPRLAAVFFTERLAARYKKNNGRLTAEARRQIASLAAQRKCLLGFVHGADPAAAKPYDSQAVVFSLLFPAPGTSGDIRVCSKARQRCYPIKMARSETSGEWLVQDFSALVDACLEPTDK